MIIGLYALLSMTFFGNTVAFLPLDHFRRDVNTYVEEKDRRKEVIRVIDDYEVKLAENFQERNKNVANLIELNTKYETSEDEYEIIIDTLNHQSEIHLHYLIDEWRNIASMFTNEEWTKIVEIDTSGLEKERNQDILNATEIRTHSGKIKATIQISIENKEDRIRIMELYTAFFTEYMTYYDNLYLRDSEDLKSFAAYKLNDSYHQGKIEEYLTSEMNTLNYLKLFHFELKMVVEKKEWKEIMSQKNKIFELEKAK
jgi:hypothetical protein